MAASKLRTALVIGASRGIGRQIALTLAKNNFQVGVAAKTVVDNPLKLSGTIMEVSQTIKETGGFAVPLKCNVRDEKEIEVAVDTCLQVCNGLDLVVYNAGAIMWNKVVETPLKKFDLMMDVNARGAYATIQKVLPYMLEKKRGKIILVSPPIYSRFFKGKTPYAVGKVGMTVLTHGLAEELKGTGVSITSLWPATVIESQVTVVKNVEPRYMRKSTIFADAVLSIANEESERLNGQALIDEDYLRSVGVTDFVQYRCDPDHEPPRMMPKAFPSLLVEEEDQNLNSIMGPKL